MKIGIHFLDMGVKSDIFLFNYVESPYKFIYDIEFFEKCLIGGILTNFHRKLPFWGSYWLLNYYSHAAVNFFRRDALFKSQLVETFITIVLITHFFIRFHILFLFCGYRES